MWGFSSVVSILILESSWTQFMSVSQHVDMIISTPSLFFSVFPAEACETIGGEACVADIYPEVRIQPEARNSTQKIASENVEREYLEYNDAKT